MVLRMRLTKKICRKKYLQVKIALEQPSPCCPPHPPHPPDPKLICEERSGYGNFLKPPSATQHWILGGAGGANDSNMSEYVPIRVVWIWAFFFLHIFFFNRTYVPTCSTTCLPNYPRTYLPTYLSTSLLPTDLPT